MTIEIKSGVPMPKAPMGQKSKYPWDQMSVGDMVVYQGKNQVVAYNVAKFASLRSGKTFEAHRMDNGQMGIWRTK